MVSIKIVQRKKPLADGSMPIALRVYKNRKTKMISLGMSCKEGEFKNQQFTKNAPNWKKRNQLLLKLRVKADDIQHEFRLQNKDFTLDEFEDAFRGIKKEQSPSVLAFFDEIIDELMTTNKVGNARAYQETKLSLFKFASDDLVFKQITTRFLEKYELHMRKKGNQDGGISFKMRTLRALFNTAIRRELVKQDIYPFKKYKVSKLKGSNTKKALTADEFNRIKELDISMHPHLINPYHYFFFSFYTRGMNFVDMMKLTWRDIQGDKIIYTRSKTKGKFVISILPPVQKILDYYKSRNPSTIYVFPILLKEGLSPQQIAYRKKKTLGQFNKGLKEIASLANVDKKITSYVARHSYATIMKQLGVSTDKISESMGHANLQVTMTYLKEFGNDVIDDANEKLLEL